MSELIKCLYEDIDDAGKDCNNNIDGKCIQRCIGRLCKKNKKLEDLAVEFSKENEVIREQLSKEIEHHIKTRTKLRKENEELKEQNKKLDIGYGKQIDEIIEKDKALKTAEDAINNSSMAIMTLLNGSHPNVNYTEVAEDADRINDEALSEIRAVKGGDGECKKHEYAIANGCEYRCVKCNREREDE